MNPIDKLLKVGANLQAMASPSSSSTPAEQPAAESIPTGYSMPQFASDATQFIEDYGLWGLGIAAVWGGWKWWQSRDKKLSKLKIGGVSFKRKTKGNK